MWGTVQYYGNVPEPFKIRNGVKQGCVLAPTLFEIFLLLLLKHTFGTAEKFITCELMASRMKIKYTFENRLQTKPQWQQILNFCMDCFANTYTIQA